MPEPEIDLVQLPNAEMQIVYSISAGELLIAALLAALIAVIVAKWFYQAIFRKGR